MNKRMRKKKRVGEFQELGFELSCVVDLEIDSPEFDKWCDDFIEMIESYGLICGGGGRPDDWSVFVSKHKGSVTEQEQDEILVWMSENKHVKTFDGSPLVDAWYENN